MVQTAAWAAKNYKPTGTPNNKYWCLPSGGLLNATLNNEVNLAKINVGIAIAGGTKIERSFIGVTIWASSESDVSRAWYFYANDSSYGMTEYSGKSLENSKSTVRPVMAF